MEKVREKPQTAEQVRLAFLACGLLFVAVEPPFSLVVLLFVLFVLARLVHTVAYATAQNHEVRARLLLHRLHRGDRDGAVGAGGGAVLRLDRRQPVAACEIAYGS
jgi:hypothetical protein